MQLAMFYVFASQSDADDLKAWWDGRSDGTATVAAYACDLGDGWSVSATRTFTDAPTHLAETKALRTKTATYLTVVLGTFESGLRPQEIEA